MQLFLDTDPEWLREARCWAERTPEVRELFLYGSRVTGVRRTKPNPSPIPDFDLAVRLHGRPVT
jgi:hypothetical protein